MEDGRKGIPQASGDAVLCPAANQGLPTSKQIDNAETRNIEPRLINANRVGDSTDRAEDQHAAVVIWIRARRNGCANCPSTGVKSQ